MPTATLNPQEPAILAADAGGGSYIQQDYTSSFSSKGHHVAQQQQQQQTPSSPTLDTHSLPNHHSNHYFSNGKPQLYNRSGSNSNLTESIEPQPPSFPKPAEANGGLLSLSILGSDDNELSTRHVESSSTNAFQNLLEYIIPRRAHFSLSDNLKFTLNCCMWYFSSSLTNNTGKQILNVFRFPVTLTFFQFGLVAMWCYSVATLFGVTQIRKPTRRIAATMAPLAGFLIVGHVFSSVSISRIPVSLVHTIKALAPLFTVLFYRFIFGVQYTAKVYISLLPLTLGVILACTFTFSNNLIGLICAFLSCLVFVTQNIFSKKLLFKEANMGKGDPNKLDKMNMLFYSSILSFILMSPLWLYSDGMRLLFLDESSSDNISDVSSARLIAYFLLNGTTNFGQNWFAFTTLSMTSPVTYSIASLVKRIFVIVMSIIWFGQQVSVAQSLGILLTFIGLWMYQSAKLDVERGEIKIREKSLDVLPTASNDSMNTNDNSTGKSLFGSWISQWNGSSRETKIL